jgi:hypothetical protein
MLRTESLMNHQLLTTLSTAGLSREAITERTSEIFERVLRESAYLDAANFKVFHPQDLRRMFELYDRTFFQDGCRELLGDMPLNFSISKRMTRAAGKTIRREQHHRLPGTLRREYEISVSGTLLFQTFCGEERTVTVSGLVCNNRLQALQRVMEHEIVHLAEMLLWTDSSCAAARFQSIAGQFFGHTQHTHELITPREKAWTHYGIRPGDHVRFRFDGSHYTGIVNRITKRATILVEDPRGVRYSNGKHYRKYYVPFNMLEKVE